jgi:hypothetical protein
MKLVFTLYVFLFAGLLHAHATQSKSKIQQNPKDCVKHPQIIKPNSHLNQSVEKTKIIAEKENKQNTISKNTQQQVPYFGVFNFINFFYTKDTLDNLRVM